VAAVYLSGGGSVTVWWRQWNRSVAAAINGVQKQIYFRLTKMYSFSIKNIPMEIVTLPIPSSPLMTQ
jgi:hypothetical protein